MFYFLHCLVQKNKIIIIQMGGGGGTHALIHPKHTHDHLGLNFLLTI